MTLLTLASKQIWPQVLAVARLKPKRVVLLHSDDDNESKRPAQRLKRFFDDSDLVPKGGLRMEPVSDTDFAAMEQRLDDIQKSNQIAPSECVLNFTGGNKLMATAAFSWASKRGIRAFYLERRNRLTWFEPQNGAMASRPEILDDTLTNTLEPVSLLRCQLDASEVERAGEKLVLSPAGIAMSDSEFFCHIQSGKDPRALLTITGEADKQKKAGDALEFATAAILLKLGVNVVQRSLCLKVKSAQNVGTKKKHAEMDLLFIWAGKLWLVDCKDRMPAENLAENLGRMLPHLTPDAQMLFDRIKKELSIGQIKIMKEDIVGIREMGGLLGAVVCVRKSQLNEDEAQYAKHNNISVIYKNELREGCASLLFPNQSANVEQLTSLAAHFK